MRMLSVMLACVGAGISLFGVSQYFRSILHGDTRPRMASWIAWLSANAVFCVIALLGHTYLAVAINGVSALANLAIIVVSMAQRQGQKPSGITDWSCLASALVCLLVLAIFPDNKALGASLAMAANVIATWPTIVHAWHRPREEAWQLFAANAAANGLAFMGVATTNGLKLSAVAGPMMAVLGNVSLTMITAGRSWLTNAEELVEAEIHKVEEEISEKLAHTSDKIAD
jgi:hypothetical protein